MSARDPRPTDWRGHLTPQLEQLLAAIIDETGEFHGLQARQILLVSLGAHGGAVASVRPLPVAATTTAIDGHRRRIELGLRPLFFLATTPGARLVILIHELLHLDLEQPGRLRASMRHSVNPQRTVNALARQIAKRFMASAAAPNALCLSATGEMWMRAWTRRPVDADAASARVTARDVHLTLVHMRSAIDGSPQPR